MSSPTSSAPVPVEGEGRSRRAIAELFAISFLVLFLELACIRWFGSSVVFLTFFTNIVLMASFLGISVGCLAASRKVRLMDALIPLTLAATAAAVGTLWAYGHFSQVMVDVGDQQSPQLIYFGTDARIKDPSRFVVPMEAVAGLFFLLIALMFTGPGQELGRRLDAIGDRVVAYTVDILGSLAGIVSFGLLSYLRAPAVAWFAVAMAIAWTFTKRWRKTQLVLAAAALGTVWLADWPRDMQGVETEVTWSPYYQVKYKPRYKSIDVNNLGFQGMLPMGLGGPAYMLPHLMNRDAGGKPFEDVLIVGAGSGNDVAAALAQGASHVDAVEIDPVINGLGRLHHPDRPYSDPRVTIHLDDGRSFVRRTERKYDLISYAVVDSLALHSGYSSVRLESFLFTEQAFRDVKSKLKPGGVFVMYNYYRRGWVVSRLAGLAEKVFGAPPLVFSLPFQETITPEDDQRDHITFLIAGDPDSATVKAIRDRLAKDRAFWISPQPRINAGLDGYAAAPPLIPGAPPFHRIGPARVETTPGELTPSDDWPFLYLRTATIPALTWRGAAVVGTLSLALLAVMAPVRRARPNGLMFFLGAGFMLLETKAVVHMALLFGATWVVNSVVFAAILVMILASNLYVLTVRPKRLAPYYALLVAALLVNAMVPMATFLALPVATRTIASCLVVFLPVFFAGVIFATAFRDSQRPDIDFGSNVAGVILGGLSENLSLVLGFDRLLLVAVAYYLLSAAFRPRT
ncbi:spermine/spermidine synthase domain-containing protein [Paludisphaera soli]|uniref:spermine/spermidine synthase domain-containing protein n=1 Tax=Paludisphaera soli TaxID=2712865 RepID=UPI0013EBE887|nr:hypothetical protein [Paludisphaera soli]